VPKLWLTYAWKDNEDEQVDYVAQEISQRGIEVCVDRTHLIPGQRLWPQLDKAISDPANCDAWAIYVTENSLRSEPCLEELAYALDRALRTRGTSFPIMGIFPAPLDRAIIPSAIATRLYVDLRMKDWAARVADGARIVAPSASPQTVPPFDFRKWSEGNGAPVYEVRPRAGRWYPFVLLVKKEERSLLRTIAHGPAGRLPRTSMVSHDGSISAENGALQGEQISNVIDPLNSAFAYFVSPPSQIVFGQRDETLFTLAPETFKNDR
jgi:hypothetical protein